jgi:hypothetical protein
MEYQIGALVIPGVNEGKIVKTEHFNLEVMQKAVGGLIERVYLSQELEDMGIDAFVNEEGKLRDLMPSAVVYDKSVGDSEEGLLDVIAGPILFVGHDGEGGTIGLSETQKDWIVENLCEFCQAVNGEDPDDVLKLMIFRR